MIQHTRVVCWSDTSDLIKNKTGIGSKLQLEIYANILSQVVEDHNTILHLNTAIDGLISPQVDMGSVQKEERRDTWHT